MKTVSFYAKGNRSGDNLHIETDGCVINVFVGLHDTDGHQVTNVSISPDDESRGGDGEGRIWVQDGSRLIRLHEGETSLPDPSSVTVTWDQAQLNIALLGLHRIAFGPPTESSPVMQHCALSALQALQSAGEPKHAHRYGGQSFTHAHVGGHAPHGYYEHPEDAGLHSATKAREEYGDYSV